MDDLSCIPLPVQQANRSQKRWMARPVRSLVDGRMAKMMVTIIRIPPVKRYTISSKFCAAVWELKRKDNLGRCAAEG